MSDSSSASGSRQNPSDSSSASGSRQNPSDSEPDATGAGRLWGARLSERPDEAAWRLGVSTAFDQRLARHDLAGSRAHAQELLRIGVLDHDECEALLEALDECAALFADGEFAFEPTDEDVHGAIERWLVERLGPVGGKLRAGRSRNDQVANDLRLYVREAAAGLRSLVADLQSALLEQAEAHLHTLAPGFTHLQRAQPVLLAHHLLAHLWVLDRDAGRLADASGRADESVLGAGALAGTSLPVDPAAYARHLGYGRVARNSIDAVAARDFALEFLAAAAILATTVSRLAEEVVLWVSQEFAYARVGDAFSTGSSIMPQKRNPDVAELARGKTGRVVGDLMALLTTVKGLPLAYDRDLQEDKEPVFDAVDTLEVVLPAMAGTVASLDFDTDRLEAAAGSGFALATELAEELVRRGVPFREAHEVVGDLVRRAEARGVDLDGLDPSDIVGAHAALDRSVADVLDVRQAVQRRDSVLGTASTAVATQLRAARDAVARNR